MLHGLRLGPCVPATPCLAPRALEALPRAIQYAPHMKILLTGAGGQIGHDLIGALVAQGHDVVSTDLAPRTPAASIGNDSMSPIRPRCSTCSLRSVPISCFT